MRPWRDGGDRRLRRTSLQATSTSTPYKVHSLTKKWATNKGLSLFSPLLPGTYRGVPRTPTWFSAYLFSCGCLPRQLLLCRASRASSSIQATSIPWCWRHIRLTPVANCQSSSGGVCSIGFAGNLGQSMAAHYLRWPKIRSG